MFPCCVSVGLNLARSCRQRGASYTMFNLGPIWVDLRPTSAQHDLWRQLGSSWAKIPQLEPKVGPTRANFADSRWHAENITTLLAPLTPPQGVKNVTYIITFLYPPRNIGIWGGCKKCNMDIARGYTCYVTFSKAPPHEQPRKYFGVGGP